MPSDYWHLGKKKIQPMADFHDLQSMAGLADLDHVIIHSGFWSKHHKALQRFCEARLYGTLKGLYWRL